MALALKSYLEDQYDDRLSSLGTAKSDDKITPISRRSRTPLKTVASETPVGIARHIPAPRISKAQTPSSPSAVVRLQSSTQPAPSWLKWLVVLQRGSSALGFGLVSLTLAIYGNTVYSQQKWDAATEQLDRLQRDERQLDLMTEALKHQIAQDTDQSATGLVPQQPANFLVLPSAALRPTPPSPAFRPASFSPPKGY